MSSSRGRRVPRGVKRKMGNYPLRPLRQSRTRPVRLRVTIVFPGRIVNLTVLPLDGKPIFLSRSRVAIESDAQVQMWGNSVETRALVGRVRFSRGVPDDIDWEAFAKLQQRTKRAPPEPNESRGPSKARARQLMTPVRRPDRESTRNPVPRGRPATRAP